MQNIEMLKFMKTRLGPCIVLEDLDWQSRTLHWKDTTLCFVQQVKYLGAMLDRRITWRIAIQTKQRPSEQHLLLNQEWLSGDIKLTLHKALMSTMTCTCLTWVAVTDMKIAAQAKQDSLCDRQLSKVHSYLWFAVGLKNSIHLWVRHKIM